jgi:membrane associated rhomboid family serine protease
MVAAGLGAVWGLAGYALLWGHTPIVVHRPFVVSAVGTAVLLPVRLVLLGIRFVEEHVADGPFDFSGNNAWIGVLAAVVGAILVAAGFLLIRAVSRRREAAPAGRGR